MKHTYIYRSPIYGGTAFVTINKKKKTFSKIRVRDDYSKAFGSGLVEHCKWIKGICDDLEKCGFNRSV